jgi:hypothetical protein
MYNGRGYVLCGKYYLFPSLFDEANIKLFSLNSPPNSAWYIAFVRPWFYYLLVYAPILLFFILNSQRALGNINGSKPISLYQGHFFFQFYIQTFTLRCVILATQS